MTIELNIFAHVDLLLHGCHRIPKTALAPAKTGFASPGSLELAKKNLTRLCVCIKPVTPEGLI
jgi:hypothetical protein